MEVTRKANLSGQHVAEHPPGHPADLTNLDPPEVEARMPSEADPAQGGDEGRGLSDDAERGADPEQKNLSVADRADVINVLSRSHHHERKRDNGHDDVVNHRSPHGRREVPASVEYRAGQR